MNSNKKRNVLILFDFPWWNAAAYYLYNVVLSLNKLDYNIFFAGKSGTKIWENLRNIEIKLYDISFYKTAPLKLLKSYSSIKKIVDEEKIDILLPAVAQGHIVSGMIKKFIKREIPIIKLCLDNVSPVNNPLNKYLHNSLTDYFIFPGQSTKSRYKPFFEISDFKIIHAPIDYENFLNYKPKNELHKALDIPEGKTVVSFIGRFSPEKGIFFLLEIIKKVSEKNENLFFILSGSEEQVKYSEVEESIRTKNLTKIVKIIPKQDDVRDLLSITDIGLMSSRYSEYICRIALEFMAFKIPIVAPELNVIPEVVENDVTGFIYPLNDSYVAAEKLLNLAKDISLRNKMGKEGFNKIQNNYSLNVFAEEMKDILHKVIR
jgi:glycosyltransferase involved in cell wall biosynthesis